MATFTSVAPSKLTGVTLLTGFLGAGKTTLLNKLLTQLGNKKRLAVIENEYGEINVDSALVSDKLSSNEDVLPLPGGCVCCSLRKDIVKALTTLQRTGAAGGGYDGIVLETTGLADPAPVAFTFLSNPWIRRNFRLDSIVCVVDAKNLPQHLAHGRDDNSVHEVINQIAFADLILINKMDLVDQTQLQQVLAEVRAINATAEVIQTQLDGEDSHDWMEQILDRNFFSVDRALEIDPDFLRGSEEEQEDERPTDAQPADAEPADAHSPFAKAQSAARTDGAADGNCANSKAGADGAAAADDSGPKSKDDPDAAQRPEVAAEAAPGASSGRVGAKRSAATAELEPVEADKRPAPAKCIAGPSEAHLQLAAAPKRVTKRLHDLSRVTSIGVTVYGEIDAYRFNMFMLDLVAARGRDIYRTKGVIHVHGFEKPFVIQGVHETFSMGPANLTRAPVAPGAQPSNTIVFIGQGIEKDSIREGLRTCVWIPLPEGWSEHRDDKTKRTYYFNPSTGENSWVRPELLCPHVTTEEYAVTQPPNMRPRGSLPTPAEP